MMTQTQKMVCTRSEIHGQECSKKNCPIEHDEICPYQGHYVREKGPECCGKSMQKHKTRLGHYYFCAKCSKFVYPMVLPSQQPKEAI